jgi:hypothetical protein
LTDERASLGFSWQGKNETSLEDWKRGSWEGTSKKTSRKMAKEDQRWKLNLREERRL